MTALLERAFHEAAQLTDEDQDALAGWLLEELRSEQEWGKRFDASPDLLLDMSREALAEDHRGETEPLDPDDI
jgi:hypothetical protein